MKHIVKLYGSPAERDFAFDTEYEYAFNRKATFKNKTNKSLRFNGNIISYIFAHTPQQAVGRVINEVHVCSDDVNETVIDAFKQRQTNAE